MKKAILYPLVTTILVIFFSSFNLRGQVRTPTLYVTGTVNSDEKMLVTVRETKYIQGQVVSKPFKVTAEINGKKTESNTDRDGHALLDFAAIATGLVNPTEAVIKSFDKKGNLLSSSSTMVHPGNTRLNKAPEMENLPANISNGEAVTIQGQHLGADAKLYCGDQIQETLAASDKEMTVFTKTRTGEQPVYVMTSNGVSQSRKVNFYSIDFILAKNSITPREIVQAMAHFESMPIGTKLIFTNMSPETINIAIPGGQNIGNESIYTVAEKKGSIPLGITGLTRGNFTISLNTDFSNENEGPPPHNLQPADGKIFTESETEKPILFSWTPVEQGTNQVNYIYTIKPVFKNQSKTDAIEKNPDLLQRTLSSTTFQYLPDDPKFSIFPDAIGFVWRVRAVNSQGSPIAGNNGYSEIYGFVPPLFKPEFKNGDIVHVESSPGGTRGFWLVRVKFHLNDKNYLIIYIIQDDKPDLKFCNWIKITDVTTDKSGTTTVKKWEKVPDDQIPGNTGQKPDKPVNPPKQPPAVPVNPPDKPGNPVNPCPPDEKKKCLEEIEQLKKDINALKANSLKELGTMEDRAKALETNKLFTEWRDAYCNFLSEIKNCSPLFKLMNLRGPDLGKLEDVSIILKGIQIGTEAGKILEPLTMGVEMIQGVGEIYGAIGSFFDLNKKGGLDRLVKALDDEKDRDPYGKAFALADCFNGQKECLKNANDMAKKWPDMIKLDSEINELLKALRKCLEDIDIPEVPVGECLEGCLKAKKELEKLKAEIQSKIDACKEKAKGLEEKLKQAEKLKQDFEQSTNNMKKTTDCMKEVRRLLGK